MAKKNVNYYEEITIMRFSAERIFAAGKIMDGIYSSPVKFTPSEAVIIDRMAKRIRRRIDLRLSRRVKAKRGGFYYGPKYNQEVDV